MQPDFPAAHSMDTEWYAVDRDGQVAVFRTYSEGAVPVGACHEEWEGVRELLAGEAPRSVPIFDPVGSQSPADLEAPHVTPWEGHVRDILVFPRASELPSCLAGLEFERVQATRGSAWIVRACPAVVLSKLHETDECGTCHWWFDSEYDGDPEEDAVVVARRAGFYVYKHRSDDWLAAPYDRHEIPSKPVRIQDLPAEVAERIRACTFADLSFRETTHIQPVERGRASTWGPAFLSLDGIRIRPVPGKEKEFAEEGRTLQDRGPDGEYHDI